MITITKNSYELHEDIDKDLFNHDFELSMYEPNEIQEYIEDFLDTQVIPYVKEVDGNKTTYSFDASKFSGALEMKYDNYGIDY